MSYLATTFLGAALTMVIPQMVRLIIDDAIPSQSTRLLLALCIAIAGMSLASGLLSLVSVHLASTIGQGFVYNLRRRLFEHIQTVPYSFFLWTRSGSLVSRIDGDTSGLASIVTVTVAGIVEGVVRSAVLLTAIVVIDPRIAVLVLVGIPPLVFAVTVVSKRIEDEATSFMRAQASMSAFVAEHLDLAGLQLTRLSQAESTDARSFGTILGQVRATSIRLRDLGAVPPTIMAAASGLSLALVYYVGGIVSLTSQSITTGELVAVGIYTTQFFGPVRELSQGRVELAEARVVLGRLIDVLTLPSESGGTQTLRTADIEGRITFDNVSFRYVNGQLGIDDLSEANTQTGDSWLFEQVDFELEAGSTTVLIGASGVGKSTLARLIPRLLTPSSGTVSIDGQNIEDVTLSSLRKAVGYVSQDAAFFHGSVIDNLTYGLDDVSHTDVVRSCQLATMHSTIMQMPLKYDTPVGDSGYRLSGGERQRLSLARVLLRDCRIVVIDELAAHLDADTAGSVYEGLARALRGRTVLFIAHEVLPQHGAGSVLVLANGRLQVMGASAD